MTAPQFGVGEWKTRDGRKAVVKRVHDGEGYPLIGNIEGDYACWTLDGRWHADETKGRSDNDLILLWVEVPADECQPSSRPRKKGVYIGAPACFALELAVRQVREAFGDHHGHRYSGCFVVGSVLERPDWRDVDVRLIMADSLFEETFPGAGDNWEFDAKWLLLTTAISEWLSKQTGLPIDFQFQPQTHANNRYKGPRNAAGLKLASAKRGGA